MASHYARSAEFYDLLYSGAKDYRAEAELLAGIIREEVPDASTVLDVACGTGEHARWLTALGFRVDGLDLDDTFVRTARAKCPDGSFTVADMAAFEPHRYDAVLSLFSAIGYARTTDVLEIVIARLAAAVRPGGIVIVDPWFEPGQLTDGWVSMVPAETDQLKVCRVSRTVIEGRVSKLEFAYVVARPDGLDHFREEHALGLFTQVEMEDAFVRAGLTVRRLPEALRTRGLYVGKRPG